VRGTGFQSDLNALLFGRILTVGQRELIETVLIAVVVIGVLLLLHKELVMRAFDPTGRPPSATRRSCSTWW
jgi:ABC-type Mn2+/Zn2+ transport system permease subunit